MRRPDDREVDRTGFAGSRDQLDGADAGDIGAEHTDTTLAGEVRDGPEHAREPESPHGRSGMDEAG